MVRMNICDFDTLNMKLNVKNQFEGADGWVLRFKSSIKGLNSMSSKGYTNKKTRQKEKKKE